MAAQATEWVENRPTAGRIVLPHPSELFEYREVALFLALQELQLRYKQTFFGVAWTVLQPLVGTVIFTFVFDRLAGVSGEGMPYAVFALSGLMVWTFFSKGLMGAAESLVKNEELVTKIYFPRLLAPLAAVLPGLFDMAIWLAALAVVMVGYGVAPTAAMVLLPLWMAALLLFTFGLGSLLAALNIRYRDVRNMLPFATQAWLLLSPVAYPSSLVGGHLSVLYSLNPVVGLLEGFRWSAVGGPTPGAEAFLGLSVGVVLVAAGILHFGRVERRFADII